jgi:hypothetical protein
MRYDPDRPVVAEEWSQLGEGEQIELVAEYSSTGAHPASKPAPARGSGRSRHEGQMGRVGASTPLTTEGAFREKLLRVQVRPSDPRRRMRGRCGPPMAPQSLRCHFSALCYCREQTHRGHGQCNDYGGTGWAPSSAAATIDGLLQRAAED